MPDQPDIAGFRRLGRDVPVRPGLGELLAAYHLQTEAEKGEPVADVDGLPERYRREVLEPGSAFAGQAALDGSAVSRSGHCFGPDRLGLGGGWERGRQYRPAVGVELAHVGHRPL